MNQNISNHSKRLAQPDDSAGALLVELLQGTTGRNFDVESLFVERLDSGQWRWVVYEFLKADTIPPKASHPNYYWHKNQRKFLSLWALVNTLRKAGYLADLILVNYADNRALGVKEMVVQSIEMHPTEVFREASNIDGVLKPRLMRHVVSKDTTMSFDEFKKKFVAFNNNKKGDTWEILNSPAPLQSAPAKRRCEGEACGKNVTEAVENYSRNHFAGKIYCMDCQKRHR